MKEDKLSMIQKGDNEGICHNFMQITNTNWDANQRIQIKQNKKN